ncbi:HofP DNA utilization family protein [Erwinia pyrifoliae]|uniref:DUF2531 family protein n=1 Tax=Erwinia pyrifoliae TaxID=79967 RepID=A0ABY5X7P8_ERWPY|nr:HofP DNA utilization family protein [Erwinia pyrifoliae]AUX71267.1 DUF2531 domain-containing protein [Erwinia pyrifoliae]MCA8875015.1 DUF2531 family protein [Erwinia pyrifoliae]MCT2385665.1 DUF2531 family protein [Erwinia pyrifoliae]MCU8588759.1 DUF2531 family protein [Erwinia pyrifoliae]UWS29120.1 DUF2531 family protein [Erwinia pyrifoliae]
MNAKLACALLLLLMFNSRARDPFFPPQSHLCQPLTPADSGWRLLGVIGRSDYYHAWLAASGGKTLRRKTGDLLPGTPWRVTRIDAHGTTLTPIQDCQPAQRLVLKGRHNAQNSWSVDGIN